MASLPEEENKEHSTKKQYKKSMQRNPSNTVYTLPFLWIIKETAKGETKEK